VRNVLAIFAFGGAIAASFPPAAVPGGSRLREEAANVAIVRDDWGIAHVRGKTDAQAVFGAIYAQAEDDFNRVEMNYIDALGRRAEVEGERAIYRDLRMKMFVDPADLGAKYAACSPALRALMEAWADGLNYYLATHPAVHPRLLRRFEPWMALSFTEGSIGGDIERISLDGLRAFYGGSLAPTASHPDSAAAGTQSDLDAARMRRDFDPSGADRNFDAPGAHRDLDVSETNHGVDVFTRQTSGSNGIAIAPSNTQSHHALLLINPHTSFYFRSELQLTSDQGLNAYGAVTWGQFFVYQGFNEHAGWMHTSSGVDVVDFFSETIVRRAGKLYYRYGREYRPVTISRIVVPYRAADGTLRQRTFTVYRTGHGPIVGSRDGKWLSVSLMQRPVEALSQAYLRTKAVDYAAFRTIAAEFRANSSNNTIFADAKGEIAYMSPQFIPRRNDRFDYTRPVDGADPATAWHGLHALDEAPHLLNPPNGWLYNTNDWPYSAAGANSPRREAYPRYMDTFGENARGIHATQLLTGRNDFTLDSLMAAAFDSYLPAFGELVPRLLADYDALPSGDPLRSELAEQVGALRAWDDRWSAASVPTTLAVFWGEALSASLETGRGEVSIDRLLQATPQQQLAALVRASERLTADFGTWKTAWGEINRFQRLNDSIVAHFDDGGPSIAVPFTDGFWGSLAASSADHAQTKRRYGVSGNSFVAVVEFGEKVRAKAVTAGGESGDPASPHFIDQAARYCAGALRDVYFYPEQLVGHTERTYHPGG
jgi:acyl-homoserine-lactone acylase